MIGWLGTTELAASAATSDFHSLFFYIGTGILTATSAMVAQARGKKDFRKIRIITQQGFLVAVLFSIPGTIIIYNATTALSAIGVEQSIVEAAIPYAHTLCLAFLPMMLMTVLHFFITAHDKTRIIFIVTLAALPLNALGNYLLLFGNFGFPELKLAGAGISTAITASFMFFALLIYIFSQKQLRRYHLFHGCLHTNWKEFREIIRLGFPIGISNIGEMGVFLSATIIVGVFGAETLAAHTIALRLAGLFYAFPLGLSQAATIRCGYLVGKQNYSSLQQAVKTALFLAITIGLLFMLIISFYNHEIASLFLTRNESTQMVLYTAASFLIILGFIQPFDGFATVCAGVLRGMKDTKIPMFLSIGSYWLAGFSTGVVLAFVYDVDGKGIWIGLATGATVFCMTTLLRLKTLWNPQIAPVHHI